MIDKIIDKYGFHVARFSIILSLFLFSLKRQSPFWYGTFYNFFFYQFYTFHSNLIFILFGYLLWNYFFTFCIERVVKRIGSSYKIKENFVFIKKE